ncbi:iron-chelator utilization protein [plant metagenome]|uniref:Iron-chelator utilization protein n=1 Tax=plant metagenome TaxID=1297885 RepID=A0A484RX11_9ZZZZ
MQTPDTTLAPSATSVQRATQRVRHDLRFRLLEVARVTQVSPRLLRVTLTGPDLDGFTSLAHDDHVKVFFPAEGQRTPVLPVMTAQGPEFPAGQPRPAARDYTPRRFDAERRELDLEFVLHGEGPAATWAAQAAPGQVLGVGGPRGSFVLQGEFDAYLLVGDETALPAIARRLEELPAHAHAHAVILVDDAEDHIAFQSEAHVAVHWVHRRALPAGGEVDALRVAVGSLALPAEGVYAWVAAESATAKALRQYLVETLNMPRQWVKAAGYWKQGAVATHESHDD